jgi:hypothetical protein
VATRETVIAVKVASVVDNAMFNPSKTAARELVNNANDMKASAKVAHDLTNVKDVGDKEINIQ